MFQTNCNFKIVETLVHLIEDAKEMRGGWVRREKELEKVKGNILLGKV